jgi:hypothetical protein
MVPLQEIHDLIRALARLQRASTQSRSIERIYRDLRGADAGENQDRAVWEAEELDEAWRAAADLVPKALPLVVPPVGQTADQFMMHVVRTIDNVAGCPIDVIGLPRPKKKRNAMGDLAVVLRHLETQLRLLGADGPLADFEPAAGQEEKPVAGSAPKTPRAKRSTERGEGRLKLIAALTKHHKYADGGCLNLEPAGNNELARKAHVSNSTASELFKKKFKGHAKYRAVCGDTTQLVTALKLLNQEFSPHHLYGGKPPGEDERDGEG